MRVISKTKLREFAEIHPDVQAALDQWHNSVIHAIWHMPQDVRATYRQADPIGDSFVVFNICRNDYRLVVRVDYSRLIVYIFGLYTHAAYSRLDLRALDKQIQHDLKANRRSESGDR